MTTAFLSSMRQRLSKPWLRCAACLCLLFVGYFVSAGSMIGLVFHPRLDSLPFSKQLRTTTFSLYTPVILISKSGYCPRAIRHHLSWSIGEQRKRVFSHAMTVTKRGFRANSTVHTSHLRTSTPNLDHAVPRWSFWDWQNHQLLSFGASLLNDAQEIAFAKMDPAERSRQLRRHSGFEFAEACKSSEVLVGESRASGLEKSDAKLNFFVERPDLIMTDRVGDEAMEDPVPRMFNVSVIDIRDEQELSTSSPSTRDQAPVYTFRVANPELLLDESHVVQLRCTANTPGAEEKYWTLPSLGNRIVCQKEFPHRDHQPELLNIIMGFNR